MIDTPSTTFHIANTCLVQVLTFLQIVAALIASIMLVRRGVLNSLGSGSDSDRSAPDFHQHITRVTASKYGWATIIHEMIRFWTGASHVEGG